MSDAKDEVGYRKPPKRFQFKPGRSGNPKGRPKNKTETLFATFKSLMSEKIGARIDGLVQVMAKNEAMIRQLFAQATKCDQRAFKKFLWFADKAGELKDISPIVTGGVIVIGEERPRQPTENRRLKTRPCKRLKGSKAPENLLTIFKRVLNEKITLPGGRTMTRGQAVLAVNYQNALAGNQRAMHNILMLAEQEGLFKDLTNSKQAGGFLVVSARAKTEEEFEERFGEEYRREARTRVIPIEFVDDSSE
jgi:Family of unknown function (DUF5681)